MRSLYITADTIGAKSGGGRVTLEEYNALSQLGRVDPFDRARVGDYADPFEFDQKCCEMLKGFSNLPEFKEIKLAHFYSGTFTKTINFLQGRGIKISYTCAAHDRHLSAKEHESTWGQPFQIQHMKDGPLWESYVAGYRDADLLITPSEYSRQLMLKYGCRSERAVVIPHGCEPAEPPPFPKRFTVGYMGSAGSDKGLRYLFEAWKQLNLKDSQLLLAGPYSHIGITMDLIRKFGGGNIRCLGFVPTLKEFYEQISCYVQPSACLLAGTPVMTQAGPKAIEKLTDHDTVLTSDGHFHKVVAPLKNDYRGPLYKVTAACLPVEMTAPHRVLCIKRGLTSRKAAFFKKMADYTEAVRLHKEERLGSRVIAQKLGRKERQVASWLYYGSRPEGLRANHSVREDSVKERLEWVYASDLEVGDIVVVPRMKAGTPLTRIVLPKKVIASSSNASIELPDSVQVDAGLLRLLGFYVSEGCATSSGDVAFCFHKEEKEFIADVVEQLSTKFGVKPRVREHKVKQSTTVWVSRKLLADFFISLCGKGAHNKRLPPWALTLPREQLIPLLYGVWSGDGSIFMSDRGRVGATFSTVSVVLAQQVFTLLVNLGFKAKLYDAGARGFTVVVAAEQVEEFAQTVLGMSVAGRARKKQRPHTHIDADYYYVPIHKIEVRNYRGPVFNLEVETDHSYTVPFVVHNSEGFGIEILEAMAHGRPVIASKNAGGSECLAANDAGRVNACMPFQIEAMLANLAKMPVAALETIGKRNAGIAAFYTWGRIRQQYCQQWAELFGPAFVRDVVPMPAIGGVQLLIPPRFENLNWDSDRGVIDKHWTPKPGDTCIDVGCGPGIWSLVAAKRGARVIAYDPRGVAHDILLAVASANGLTDKITHRRVGVWANNGELNFSESSFMWNTNGTSSLVPVVSLDYERDEATFLDADFINIDAEGAELFVLDGAQEVLERNRPKLCIDVHANVSLKDIEKRLKVLGAYDMDFMGKYVIVTPLV